MATDDEEAQDIVPAAQPGAPGAAGPSGLSISLGPQMNSLVQKRPVLPGQFVKGAKDEQAGFAGEIAGKQAELSAQQNLAQDQVDVMQGFSPGASRLEDPFEEKRGIDQAAKDANYMRERQRLDAEWKAKLRQKEADLQEKTQRASEDPKGYWDDKSNGERIMSRIGVALGALGAGLTGGPNQALLYLNSKIEHDIEQKKFRAEHLMKLAEQSRGALSDAYRQRAEELSDIDSNRAIAWNVAQRSAEMLAKAYGPQVIGAQGQQFLGQLQQKAGAAWAGNMAKGIGENTTTTPTPTAASRPQPIYDTEGNVVSQAPTHVAQALTTETKAKQAALVPLQKLIELSKASHVWDRSGFPTERAHNMEQAYSELRAALPSAMGFSPRLTKEQKELVEGIAQQGTVFNAHVEQLEDLAKTLQGQLNTSFNVSGAQGTAPNLGAQKHSARQPTQASASGGGLAARYQKAQADLVADPSNAQARKELDSLKALVGGR